MTPREALLNKGLLVVTGFIVTLFLRALYRAVRARSLHPLVTALVIFIISFASATVWRETQQWLFVALSQLQAAEKISLRLFTISLGTLMYDGFVLLAWSLLYFGINDWMELARQRERAAKAEAMAQAARLRALQSQLAPHFLFNTLNSISTLVVEGETAPAARMIARLSDFLRLTLEAHDTPQISVAEELEFVRRYLEIEQVRFGDRLRVKIDAAPGAMSASVPALILQPLVENAVKHGVLHREQGGTIKISVAKSNGTLHIEVADDGPGLPKNLDGPTGKGLANTRSRLQELYGKSSAFLLDSSSEGGVVATIQIPVTEAAKLHRDSAPRKPE